MSCSPCALRAVGGWSLHLLCNPGWVLGKLRVASQHCCVCCWQGSHSGSLALHDSHPGDALLQQISNSTSDSGAVWVMPKSSLLLTVWCGLLFALQFISQTRQLRKLLRVCSIWSLIRCRGWGEGSGKGILTAFLHSKLSSCSVLLDLFTPHKTFLNGKAGICSYSS